MVGDRDDWKSALSPVAGRAVQFELWSPNFEQRILVSLSSVSISFYLY